MQSSTFDLRQRRAIFFVFDGGTGLGHLRRLARIAKKLQGQFACLLVTGHRAAANWFIPEECEYIHVPSWDNLLAINAQYWGRKPFMSLDIPDAVRLRKEIISRVVEAFNPDVIFVDHLPLGAHEELADIIANSHCLKYLVTRGVLNETENLSQLILGGKAYLSLKSHYDKILVAADIAVFDFCKQYNITAALRAKTFHTGYVIDEINSEQVQDVRRERGLSRGDSWVVASAGGGQLGEPLIESCLQLANIYKHIKFDIVIGPRSNLPWHDNRLSTIIKDNVHLHKHTEKMPYLHAGADLVISTGGYNSLLEALQGSAKILCFPYRVDHRDEQYHHATCLESFVDLRVSTNLQQLPELFKQAIDSISFKDPCDRRKDLDCNGIKNIERIVLHDLGIVL